MNGDKKRVKGRCPLRGWRGAEPLLGLGKAQAKHWRLCQFKELANSFAQYVDAAIAPHQRLRTSQTCEQPRQYANVHQQRRRFACLWHRHPLLPYPLHPCREIILRHPARRH